MSENYEVPYKELGAMGRAIDAYVLASVRAERDRIIALFPPCPDMGDANTCTCQMYFADEIIALIKGENK